VFEKKNSSDVTTVKVVILKRKRTVLRTVTGMNEPFRDRSLFVLNAYIYKYIIFKQNIIKLTIW
jgi:hypothetical protein